MAASQDEDISANASDVSPDGHLAQGRGAILPHIETSADDTKVPTLTPRAYQLEMLEESMQRNIIAVVKSCRKDISFKKLISM